MGDMDHLANRLEAAADALTTVDHEMSALSVPPAVFGGDEAGVPGRLGRELHARWTAVLDARAREATDAAAHLTDLARLLRTTARSYGDADDAAARRIHRSA
jgi:hypothetical protein